MKILQRRLTNNLKVLLINKPHLPTVTLMYFSKVGSLDEPQGKNGLCTLTRRMNLRGTKKFPDTYKFNLEVEKLGASISSSSAREVTAFSISAERKFLPKISNILSDVILNPTSRKTDLEKEKIILASHIKELENNPAEYASVAFTKQIFKGSKLANLSLGNIKHLPKITVSDIKTFRRKYFKDSSILAICGNFTKEINTNEVLSILEKDYNFPLQTKKRRKLKFSKSKKYYNYLKKDIEQPVFTLGTYAPTFKSRDYYKYSLARTILGSGFCAKTSQVIREKLYLAYYAYSFYLPTSIIGTGGIIAGVFSKKLDLAISESRKIIKDLVKGKFTNKELERAKGFYKGVLIGFNESSSAICSFYANQLIQKGKIYTFEEIIKMIESYSKKDITDVLKKYYNQKLYLTIIGNKDIKHRV